MRNAYGNIAAPADGYIWDAARARRRHVRSYGEFATTRDEQTRRARASRRCPGLEGTRRSRPIAPFDLDIPDNARVDVWLEEFTALRGGRRSCRARRSSASATTTPTARAPGTPTPRAMVAENDLALGPDRRGDLARAATGRTRRSSCSRTTRRTGRITWTRTARRCWWPARSSRRGAVDSTLYTTSGVLRTIELILGLPPMSQYDAAATPMYNAFPTTPDADAVRAIGRRASARREEPRGRVRRRRRRCG